MLRFPLQTASSGRKYFATAEHKPSNRRDPCAADDESRPGKIQEPLLKVVVGG